VPKDPSAPTEYSFGMDEDLPFVGEPVDSREAIMRATYLALREYGYAGLSIQRIADESDLSKSTFYHHYDGKEDLLTAFVDFTLEEFIRIFSLESGDDPVENLRTFVELLIGLDPDVGDHPPEEILQIVGTYVELRAQAVRDDTIREKFTEADEIFADQLSEIVRAGIEQGEFEPVDPEAAATFIATVLAGNIFRRTTGDAHDHEALADEINAYIESRLLA